LMTASCSQLEDLRRTIGRKCDLSARGRGTAGFDAQGVHHAGLRIRLQRPHVLRMIRQVSRSAGQQVSRSAGGFGRLRRASPRIGHRFDEYRFRSGPARRTEDTNPAWANEWSRQEFHRPPR
jgi:hypothetical protein